MVGRSNDEMYRKGKESHSGANPMTIIKHKEDIVFMLLYKLMGVPSREKENWEFRRDERYGRILDRSRSDG